MTASPAPRKLPPPAPAGAEEDRLLIGREKPVAVFRCYILWTLATYFVLKESG